MIKARLLRILPCSADTGHAVVCSRGQGRVERVVSGEALCVSAEVEALAAARAAAAMA